MRKFDHHIGDYSAATAHLTLVEDGVYHRLLRHYYMTEEALPGDHLALCRIVRARSKAEKAAVDAVLCEFFYFDTDTSTYRQNRCEREIVLMRARAEDANAKKDNELSRMERYRQDRKHMAAGLRAKGHVIRWDLPMSELRDLAKLHGVSLVAGVDAAPQDVQPATHLQRSCNAPATANHQPTTNHQPPTTNHPVGIILQPQLNPETEQARDGSAADLQRQPATVTPATEPETAVLTEPATPTEAGRICKMLKTCGIADVSPGNQNLLLLIKAGCSDDEFRTAAGKAKGKSNAFAYLLTTLINQRTEAAAKLATMHTGPLPEAVRPLNSQEALEASNRAVAMKFIADRRAAREAAAAQNAS